MKLSIITINLNNKVGLQKTIQSVMSQEFREYEHIVIDGNSCDGSKDLIDKYKDNLFYTISEPDSGIYNAMNKGIKKATGDYCLFLNSGDSLCSNQILSQCFSTPLVADLVYGDINITSAADKILYSINYPLPSALSAFSLFNRSLPHPATFIRRTLFTTHGLYQENFKIISDWLFFNQQIISHNATLKKIPIIVSNHTNDGISNNPKFDHIKAREKTIALKESFPYLYQDFKNVASTSFHAKNLAHSLKNDIRNFIKKIYQSN